MFACVRRGERSEERGGLQNGLQIEKESKEKERRAIALKNLQVFCSLSHFLSRSFSSFSIDSLFFHIFPSPHILK